MATMPAVFFKNVIFFCRKRGRNVISIGPKRAKMKTLLDKLSSTDLLQAVSRNIILTGFFLSINIEKYFKLEAKICYPTSSGMAAILFSDSLTQSL